MGRTIALATLVAGALDILFAICLSVYFGRNPMDMLRYVASGPFPPATEWGNAGSALGLAVHFSLMAIMAAGFVAIIRWRQAFLETPLRSGIAYGLITYVAMNWVVVPLRFHTPLPPKPLSIGTQLFAHIILVGIPMALIASKNMRTRAFA